MIERDAGATDLFRFFRVVQGDLTLVDTTLRNGIGDTGIGGGSVLVSNGALQVTNSSLTDNSAGRGGAITLAGANSSAELDGVLFAGNIVNDGGSGGAITVINGARLTVRNSTFAGNQSVRNGGAISIESTDASATILNSTFSGNATHIAGVGMDQASAKTDRSENLGQHGRREVGRSGPLLSVRDPRLQRTARRRGPHQGGIPHGCDADGNGDTNGDDLVDLSAPAILLGRFGIGCQRRPPGHVGVFRTS